MVQKFKKLLAILTIVLAILPAIISGLESMQEFKAKTKEDASAPPNDSVPPQKV